MGEKAELKLLHTTEVASHVNVVFVHGLEGDWINTWRHPALPKEDRFGWPGWVPSDLAQIGMGSRVFAYDYPACATEWTGFNLPLFDSAGLFLESLALKLDENPVLFICHSLGGLLVKRMLAAARNSGDPLKLRLPEQTKAIFFLGTPHQGSGIPSIVNTILPKLLSRNTILVEELSRGNPELRSMNDVFRQQYREYQWQIHQYAESRRTFGAMIVDEFSANCGFGEYVVTDEDHLSISKPLNRDVLQCLRALRIIQQIAS